MRALAVASLRSFRKAYQQRTNAITCTQPSRCQASDPRSLSETLPAAEGTEPCIVLRYDRRHRGGGI